MRNEDLWRIGNRTMGMAIFMVMPLLWVALGFVGGFIAMMGLAVIEAVIFQWQRPWWGPEVKALARDRDRRWSYHRREALFFAATIGAVVVEIIILVALDLLPRS